jgi:hypothetical protein
MLLPFAGIDSEKCIERAPTYQTCQQWHEAQQAEPFAVALQQDKQAEQRQRQHEPHPFIDLADIRFHENLQWLMNGDRIALGAAIVCDPGYITKNAASFGADN